MTVKDFMTKDITSISVDSDAATLLKIMINQKLSTVPVVDSENRYAGCVSTRSIFKRCAVRKRFIPWFLFGRDIEPVFESIKAIGELSVSDLLDRKYPVLSPFDSISKAAEMIVGSELDMIPVVENGFLKGRLHRTDILSLAINEDNKR